MAFSRDQIVELTNPLDASVVKTRKQAGFELSYVEGWHAINEANRIFGFSEWDRNTDISRLGEPQEVNGKWRVRFMAKVTITVRAGDTLISRDGIGYGSGIATDLGDAHEGAIKEAETDAMKRALVTFGNPFGLALYDKAQANVQNCAAANDYMKAARKGMKATTTRAGARQWWENESELRRTSGITQDQVDQLKAELVEHVNTLPEDKKKEAA